MVKSTVTVGALTYRVITDGSEAPPNSPIFVLIHGVGMSHRYLTRLRKALSARGTSIAIDMPGFGGLPKPGMDVGVAKMGQGLAEVIESLAAGPVVLIGHSMGAQWAAEAARHRPQLVERLTIIGPVVDVKRRHLCAQMAGLARDSLGETPRVNWIVTSDYFRCGPRWYFAQVRHMMDYPIEDRVAHLPVPVLVVRGHKDPIAKRAWCERLSSCALDGAFVEIPHGRHVVQESAPDMIADAICAFASDADRGSEPIAGS